MATETGQPLVLTREHLNVLLPNKQTYYGGAVYPSSNTYEDEARSDTTYAQPLRKQMYLSPTPSESKPAYRSSALSTSTENQVGHAVADTAGKIWNLPNTMLGLGVGIAGLARGAKVSFGHNAILYVHKTR